MFDENEYKDTYVTIPQCAALLGISEERVRRLAELDVLKWTYFPWDHRQLVVQPAIVPSFTDVEE